MTVHVAAVHATEILDFRARSTLAVTTARSDRTTTRTGVSSGASTGSREAVELRDGDPARYRGQGVREAVSHIEGEMSERLVTGSTASLEGPGLEALAHVDRALIDLDGTPTKSRLGANAIIGVSMAVPCALAVSADLPLWRILTAPGAEPRLPVPHFNVVNGGAHAAHTLDFQEFKLGPLGAPSLAEAARAGAEAMRRSRPASPPSMAQTMLEEPACGAPVPADTAVPARHSRLRVERATTPYSRDAVREL